MDKVQSRRDLSKYYSILFGQLAFLKHITIVHYDVNLFNNFYFIVNFASLLWN